MGIGNLRNPPRLRRMTGRPTAAVRHASCCQMFRLTRRTKHEHDGGTEHWRDIMMTGFVRDIAAIISVTVFIASVSVLSETVRLLF